MTVQSTIPSERSTRDRLRVEVARFMKEKSLSPPLSVNQLRTLAKEFIFQNQLTPDWEDWIVVHINNALWRDVVAAVPHERRILLMPQCIRNSRDCKASFDEWGLLCAGCRGCSIDTIQEEADKLGIITIVSEGYSGVEKLLQSGEAEAVIGVACLESLEKSYPKLIGKAVAAVAVVLNESNCVDTTYDNDSVMEFLQMKSPSIGVRIDFDHLHNEVKSLFTLPSLYQIAGRPRSESHRLAFEFVSRSGNRWRPFLAAALYSSLTGNSTLAPEIIPMIVAIELFHKASLVHDDIEDGDHERDGHPALHTLYGMPMAVNMGDMLLAEGYRLLAECGDIELMKLSTQAVVDLSIGQGCELEWNRQPSLISMKEVIDIFAQKTSPAFEIALKLGAIRARASEETLDQLRSFAYALGVGYQLRDDLNDSPEDHPFRAEPNSLFAALCELHPTIAHGLIHSPDSIDMGELKEALGQGRKQVENLLTQYREEAYDSLYYMRHFELKRLLFRLVQKVIG